MGGFTAPIVADRRSVDALVLVAGMVPTPGESPAEWWTNTRYRQAVEQHAGRDGGLTGSDDPLVPARTSRTFGGRGTDATATSGDDREAHDPNSRRILRGPPLRFGNNDLRSATS
jgi:hypothetical protein